MSYLELLPAVDVKDGRAVRLVQGELAQESIYGAPLDVALEFQAAGAEWLHLVDVRGHTLAARGWTQEGGDLFETLERLDRDGCARYVVTDVAKDGTLAGPNLELLKSVCAATTKPVIASGGISSLDDIAALTALVGTGVEGAIVGKALYAGKFTLQEALKVSGK
jgi:phosphoribosylformimino-5-aminoimidazole carboxamide ribonucleotide (ProFAR) isomerase